MYYYLVSDEEDYGKKNKLHLDIKALEKWCSRIDERVSRIIAQQR